MLLRVRGTFGGRRDRCVRYFAGDAGDFRSRNQQLSKQFSVDGDSDAVLRGHLADDDASVVQGDDNAGMRPVAALRAKRRRQNRQRRNAGRE